MTISNINMPGHGVARVPFRAILPPPHIYLDPPTYALADDIAANGLKVPLRVVATEEGYRLEEGGGARRWSALRLLQERGVPLGLIPLRVVESCSSLRTS